MFPNIPEVKAKLKPQILDKSRGIMLTSVIYLLLTTWLSDLVNLVLTNPLDTIADTFSENVKTVVGIADGATLTPAQVSQVYSAALQVARDLFTQPINQIITLLFLILSLYGIFMSFGYQYYTLRVIRGDKATWQDFFAPLWNAGRLIALSLLTSLFVGCGAVFFVFPAVYFFYTLRLAPYLLLDNPELSVIRAMRLSRQIVRGHRLQLFFTDISFVGWSIGVSICINGVAKMLSPLGIDPLTTLGVNVVYTLLMAFVLPYKELTFATIYDALRPQDLKLEHSLPME